MCAYLYVEFRPLEQQLVEGGVQGGSRGHKHTSCLRSKRGDDSWQLLEGLTKGTLEGVHKQLDLLGVLGR